MRENEFDEEFHVVTTGCLHRILRRGVENEWFQPTGMDSASLILNKIEECVLREEKSGLPTSYEVE
jgi:hypothetical protein